MLTLDEVLTTNRARNTQANELNTRIGRQLFSVMSQEELAMWYEQRIGQAKRQAEIINPENLLLPALDPALIAQVEQETPKVIQLGGQNFPLSYDSNGPSVHFKGFEELKLLLRHCGPSGNLKTPSGRTINIQLTVSWYCSVESASLATIVSKVQTRLKEIAYQEWRKPDLVPQIDLTKEQSEVPPIQEVEFGQSGLDGSTFIAYGIWVEKPYRFTSNDAYFEPSWFTDKAIAEQAREKTIAYLSRKRAEMGEQLRRDAELKKVRDLEDIFYALRRQNLPRECEEEWLEAAKRKPADFPTTNDYLAFLEKKTVSIKNRKAVIEAETRRLADELQTKSEKIAQRYSLNHAQISMVVDIAQQAKAQCGNVAREVFEKALISHPKQRVNVITNMIRLSSPSRLLRSQNPQLPLRKHAHHRSKPSLPVPSSQIFPSSSVAQLESAVVNTSKEI